MIRRSGKNAFYRLSEHNRQYGGIVSLGFSEPDWNDWSNNIISAAFSLGNNTRERYKLQKHLKNYRFAPLYPGFWVRPYNNNKQILRLLSDYLSSGECRVLIGPLVPEIGADEACRLWDLKQIADRMNKRIDELEINMKLLDDSLPAKAFIAKMIEGDKAVKILADDPLLPHKLLPGNWPGKKLRDIFARFDRKATAISKPFWKKINKDEVVK